MFSLRGLARDQLTSRVSKGSSESKHTGIGPVPPPLPRRATAGGPSWKHAGVYIPSGWHHKNTCAAFQPERQFGRSPVVQLDKQMFQPLWFMAVTVNARITWKWEDTFSFLNATSLFLSFYLPHIRAYHDLYLLIIRFPWISEATLLEGGTNDSL